MTLYKYFNKIVINFLESIKDDDGNDESEWKIIIFYKILWNIFFDFFNYI